MKPFSTPIAPSIGKIRLVILLATLAAIATMVACSSNSRGTISSSMSSGTSLRADSPQTDSQTAQPAAVVNNGKASSAEKSPMPKLITYKSRDYGVSFVYPWQYSFVNARTVAEGDASLKPKSDGHDGQITLARIDIPKGFYAGTDFESGYFTLSLDQDLNQQECEASLAVPKEGKPGTDTINGVEFRWLETENGGGGHAAKLRQYVTYTNSTCYQFELGVKTRNEDGLARELDPDKVMRRLDGILRSVKVVPEERPATAEEQSSTEEPEPDLHN